MSPLQNLPPEVLYHVLSYLSISDLLAFGSTSHSNYVSHTCSLKTLHLAVFPKKVHSLIAFIQHRDEADISSFMPDSHDQISVTLPRMRDRKTASKSPTLAAAITTQNAPLQAIISRYGHSLQTLSFHAYDITPGVATALGRMASSLRSLSLYFDQPAARVAYIPGHYFECATEPSPLWNALAGVGEENARQLKLCNLERLCIERSGMTCLQLRRLIESNPRLREVRLKKVAGVDQDFLAWLALYDRRENLRLLHFQDCWPKCKTGEDLHWVGKLTGLKSFGFTGCGVEQNVVDRLNKDLWHIEELVDMEGIPQHPLDKVLEVDPDCV